MIRVIEETPERVRAAIGKLDDRQLDTPYRSGGWTLRQVVHHLADSHMNGFARLKLALTESNPTIKPYDEAAWANLPDRSSPIAPSVDLLAHLHGRFALLFRSLDDAGFRRPFHHPERGALDVDWLLQMYAWHGPHHIAHISDALKRHGW